jgi:polyferredoxin
MKTDEQGSKKVDISIEPRGKNLLEYRPIMAIAKSPFFPKIIQIPVAAVFGLIGYQLLAGPPSAHDNPGTALMWVLWWPLIPIVFLFLGRFWCAICPFATLSDFVQKLVGVNRPVPNFLKRYGIWIIDGTFIAITWADHVFGIVASPWGSGILLLLITLAVITSGAFFQRRTFCRYLCFLGGLSANYARTGMVSLRANTDICETCSSKAACFNGTDKSPACPLFQFPRTMDSNANCTLCANCVKNCPNDAITLTVRKPAKELWFINNPKVEESFLAMAIMGIVLIQNVTMLEIWEQILTKVQSITGFQNEAVIFTLLFAVGVALPVGFLYVAANFASKVNTESIIQNFARFGYALIPLDIAGHVAHNLFHLLAEGKSVYYSVAAIFGSNASGSTALASNQAITYLQFAILALGFLGSIYTVRRIATRQYGKTTLASRTLVPFLSVIGILMVLNIVMFTFPMAHRM